MARLKFTKYYNLYKRMGLSSKQIDITRSQIEGTKRIMYAPYEYGPSAIYRYKAAGKK